MGNLVIMLSVTVDNPDLPIIPPEDIRPFIDYEPGALEHWIFGGGADSLVGRVRGQTLTAQGTGYTYTDTSVTLPGYQNALISPFADAKDRTVFAVVRRPAQQGSAANKGVYWGTRAPASGSPGGNLFADVSGLLAGRLAFNYGDVDNNTRNSPLVNWTGSGVAEGDIVVLAMSEATDDSVVISINGDATTYELPNARALNLSNLLAFGNAYYGTSDYQTLSIEMFEAGVFNGAFSEAQHVALYQRTKAREALRGVTIA